MRQQELDLERQRITLDHQRVMSIQNSQGGLKYCINCGKQIEKLVSICPSCGKDLSEELILTRVSQPISREPLQPQAQSPIIVHQTQRQSIWSQLLAWILSQIAFLIILPVFMVFIIVIFMLFL
ncbi:MAG: hypothetical protein ACXACX_20085 [Candidatus Hodarchaeales archaeon]|jgi:predicted amidophosphoribosyltransferase